MSLELAKLQNSTSGNSAVACDAAAVVNVSAASKVSGEELNGLTCKPHLGGTRRTSFLDMSVYVDKTLPEESTRALVKSAGARLTSNLQKP